jgi:hypothetical protein
MDEFKQELAELKGFIAELKEDRAATKAKEKREAWTKYTSLTVVVMAVLAAVATQWGGKFSSRTLVALNNSTLQQAKASDQWGYYQAKSIKQRIAESEKDLLLKSVDPSTDSGKRELAKIDAKIAKYGVEMEEAMKKAKKLEEAQQAAHDAADHSSAQGGVMGLAVSIYQIAIALASICLVMKRKELWYVSIGLSALGVLEMIQAWYT